MSRAPLLNRDEWLRRLDHHTQQQPPKLYAMYSSITGGMVTDPALMQVPVDDHMVHRGDGIFETLKCVNGSIYNLQAHLDRLLLSARGIQLTLRWTVDELQELIVDTARAAGRADALIRILVSRGPGSMGVNPYDCPQPQIYIIVSPLSPSFLNTHPDGARVGFSSVPPKPPPLAAIKSCNYLPNALMAAEARDRELDFVLSLGPDGRILEGPTENIALVTDNDRLITPETPDVLPGTTLERILALAGPLVEQGLLAGIERTRVRRETLMNAREIMIIGTSHDIIPVSCVEETVFENAARGPVYRALRRAITKDVATQHVRRTRVF